MKKIIRLSALVASAATAALGFCACGSSETYKVYMPDGAPAIALSKLMNDGYSGAEFTVVSSSTIAQRVSKGDADFAVMPINAAAKLFNDGKDIVMLTVNTHGNLYIIGDGEFTLGGLVGKKIGVIGQGQVPDLTLKMLFEKNGIGYAASADAVAGKAAVTYADDASALAPLIKQGKIEYALLGEPAATALSSKLQKSILADVQAEWKAAFGGEYPQACLVAKGSVVESDGRFVKKFVKAVMSADGWAEDNAAAAVEAVAAHVESGMETSLDVNALTKEVIERCNIRAVSAEDAKESCDTYFARLAELKTELGTSVLSAVPGDAFYYKG